MCFFYFDSNSFLWDPNHSLEWQPIHLGLLSKVLCQSSVWDTAVIQTLLFGGTLGSWSNCFFVPETKAANIGLSAREVSQWLWSGWKNEARFQKIAGSFFRCRSTKRLLRLDGRPKSWDPWCFGKLTCQQGKYPHQFYNSLKGQFVFLK